MQANREIRDEISKIHPDDAAIAEGRRLQTFAKGSQKYGMVRNPDGTDIRPITLRSYKDARAAKNRVARKQRKTNTKKK